MAAAHEKRGAGLHTLYISPLKALAVDVARNLIEPVDEMGSRPDRNAHRRHVGVAPDTAADATAGHSADDAGAGGAAAQPRGRAATCSPTSTRSILDELHALAASKRGDLLALDLARLRTLAPGLRDDRAVGDGCAADANCAPTWSPQTQPDTATSPGRSRADRRAAPSRISPSSKREEPVPWAGHTARYAMPRCLRRDPRHTGWRWCSSTRACRPSAVPGAVAHQRRQPADRAASRLARRGAAAQGRSGDGGGPAPGRRRTSTLDLGIDWGDVDLVIHVGAPKGASRLHAADRPRQSPARRAVAGAARAGEPLRGAGMPGGASMPRRPARRTRCCRGRARSTCWRSTFWAWPAPAPFDPGRAVRRSTLGGALRWSEARHSSTAWSISSRPAATR